MRAWIQQNIDEHGIHVMNVLGDARQPGWLYTIGLWEGYEHPEIVVSGLPPRTAHGALNDLHRLIAEGHRFEHGTVDDTLANYRVAFLQVRDVTGEHLLGCSARYGDDFRAVQMVWPDAADVMPWEPGHDPHPPQELLYDTGAVPCTGSHR